jgi:hypothetical protein
LPNIFLDDQPRLPQRRPDLVTELPVLFAVRAAVVIELDIEPGEVADMGDRPSFWARIMIAVPCVSSAHM